MANAVVEKHMNGSASAMPGKSAGTSMANGVRSYRSQSIFSENDLCFFSKNMLLMTYDVLVTGTKY